MILLYVLLVVTSSVVGGTDLDEVCPSDTCYFDDIKTELSAKLAPKIETWCFGVCRDWKVLELTPNLINLRMVMCPKGLKLDVAPLPHLRMMSIYSAHISHLHNGQFAKMPTLEHLQLYRNFIRRLFHGTFQNLSQLKKLELQDNLITVLPKGVFYPLEKLEILDLTNNQISVIKEHTFAQNKCLKELFFNENPLIRLNLPTEVPNWSLTYLSLQNCVHLKHLQLFSRVDLLNLQHSRVESLQSHNIIVDIEVTNSSLTHLSLRGPQSDMAFNREVICKVQTLKRLDLSNTSLNTPLLDKLSKANSTHGDCSLPNLEFLNLSNNQFVNLPLEFPLLMPNLTSLDLSHNKLEDIQLDAFNDFPNLRSLRLERNNLRSFDYRSIYDRHRNLKELALYDNKFNSSYYAEIFQFFSDKELHLIHPVQETE